eukprot:TRINITY_DN5703_c0_g1_i1.p2 TRINITY_DN5703_c0_g1~~TRINITY_DN5703_c0_g1_i1.p2  ORF type:complete len:267 (-),score=29.45 TRINITY_DN5703_c0_g1_i1:78-878(-)
MTGCDLLETMLVSYRIRLPYRQGPLKVVCQQQKQEIVWKQAKVMDRKLVAKDKVEIHSLRLDAGEISAGYQKPGQFIQIKIGDSKPGFFAIASPPQQTNNTMEFLIKKWGETAGSLCELDVDTTVDVSPVMGKGFAAIPTDKYENVILFATGTGIAPIRALIESENLAAEKRKDVRLYYGAYNKACMAYQDLFPEWEQKGVKIIPVFSEKDQKYVQDIFASSDNQSLKSNPQASCAVVVGQKEMFQSVLDILTEIGLSKEQVLLNF